MLTARAPDRDVLMATRTFVRVSCGTTGFFLFLVAASVVTPPIFSVHYYHIIEREGHICFDG